jgi:hypothetical protein
MAGRESNSAKNAKIRNKKNFSFALAACIVIIATTEYTKWPSNIPKCFDRCGQFPIPSQMVLRGQFLNRFSRLREKMAPMHEICVGANSRIGANFAPSLSFKKLPSGTHGKGGLPFPGP